MIKNFISHILTEARVDDLKATHPEIASDIQKYNDIDPTPHKKFLPWLVSQHRKGNLMPDYKGLSNVLKKFEVHRHKLDNKDHSSYDFANLVKVVNRASRKPPAQLATIAGKQPAKSGDLPQSITDIELRNHQMTQGRSLPGHSFVPSNPIVTGIYHIKTAAAAMKQYGGGVTRPGGANWCISARSANNMFGRKGIYGPAYTIHVQNDPNSPYAYHPMGEKITGRFNDGDINADDKMDTHPYLKPAIESIRQYHQNTVLPKELKAKRPNYYRNHADIMSDKYADSHVKKSLHDMLDKYLQSGENISHTDSVKIATHAKNQHIFSDDETAEKFLTLAKRNPKAEEPNKGTSTTDTFHHAVGAAAIKLSLDNQGYNPTSNPISAKTLEKMIDFLHSPTPSHLQSPKKWATPSAIIISKLPNMKDVSDKHIDTLLNHKFEDEGTTGSMLNREHQSEIVKGLARNQELLTNRPDVRNKLITRTMDNFEKMGTTENVNVAIDNVSHALYSNPENIPGDMMHRLISTRFLKAAFRNNPRTIGSVIPHMSPEHIDAMLDSGMVDEKTLSHRDLISSITLDNKHFKNRMMSPDTLNFGVSGEAGKQHHISTMMSAAEIGIGGGMMLAAEIGIRGGHGYSSGTNYEVRKELPMKYEDMITLAHSAIPSEEQMAREGNYHAQEYFKTFMVPKARRYLSAIAHTPDEIDTPLKNEWIPKEAGKHRMDSNDYDKYLDFADELHKKSKESYEEMPTDVGEGLRNKYAKHHAAMVATLLANVAGSAESRSGSVFDNHTVSTPNFIVGEQFPDVATHINRIGSRGSPQSRGFREIGMPHNWQPQSEDLHSLTKVSHLANMRPDQIERVKGMINNTSGVYNEKDLAYLHNAIENFDIHKRRYIDKAALALNKSPQAEYRSLTF